MFSFGDRYPHHPGYVKGSDTSEAAARALAGPASSLRASVLEFIYQAPKGATDDEIEQALGMRHQTASARRRELVLIGLVMDSGERRATRSGRTATVWVRPPAKRTDG
tara:strand:+ start:157 stop:480 length:324 start_codon:yes stop_codon:yes gene_type:complete